MARVVGSGGARQVRTPSVQRTEGTAPPTRAAHGNTPTARTSAPGPRPMMGAFAAAGPVFRLSDGEGPVVQRHAKFKPFSSMSGSSDQVSGLTLDTLAEHGLQYSGGGTKGNGVNLEKMLSDSGGGSSPGFPKDYLKVYEIDKSLLRANGQSNAATLMHAINGDFVSGANNNAANIFLGSAKSNNPIHLSYVEAPIRSSLQKATSGAAKSYETKLLAASKAEKLAKKSDWLGWDAVALDLPGVKKLDNPIKGDDAKPLTQVTHVLETNDLSNVTAPWPKVVEYEVVPNYTYAKHPGLPGFLMTNIADAEKLVSDELKKPKEQQASQSQINFELAAIQVIKDHGHDLFPETLTAKAVYWFPSFIKTAPWYKGQDKDTYPAEE